MNSPPTNVLHILCQQKPSTPFCYNPVVTVWNSQPTSRPVSLAHTMAVRTLARRAGRWLTARLLDPACLFLLPQQSHSWAYSQGSSYLPSAYSCSTYSSKDAEPGHTITSTHPRPRRCAARTGHAQIRSRTSLLLRMRMRRKRERGRGRRTTARGPRRSIWNRTGPSMSPSSRNRIVVRTRPCSLF